MGSTYRSARLLSIEGEIDRWRSIGGAKGKKKKKRKRRKNKKRRRKKYLISLRRPRSHAVTALACRRFFYRVR
ncbi:hypothetical protein B296_00015106 [Ensete ventricosum]|uniref:Uncharacterized protein n=1 Tax=Ensete ventricosum TaxID=4639 RepID=A0A427AH62_ENSVE|nr:hypothetical protein B296_00015106 [Ensete ventricosum]